MGLIVAEVFVSLGCMPLTFLLNSAQDLHIPGDMGFVSINDEAICNLTTVHI